MNNDQMYAVVAVTFCNDDGDFAVIPPGQFDGVFTTRDRGEAERFAAAETARRNDEYGDVYAVIAYREGMTLTEAAPTSTKTNRLTESMRAAMYAECADLVDTGLPSDAIIVALAEEFNVTVAVVKQCLGEWMIAKYDFDQGFDDPASEYYLGGEG